MAPLAPDLRSLLETAVVNARASAESAARAVTERLAVAQPEAFSSMSPEDRRLRVILRARARQFGEGSIDNGLDELIEEIAYQQWHRMLFARFLGENDLLVHPEGVAVSLADCEEIAREERLSGESDADGWDLAARYASQMLPGIFREGDPTARIRLAREERADQIRILSNLPASLFRADDALGWVYQFWQSRANDEVNSSGRKVSGNDIPAVTQFFTEHYMVRFLLENSLGGWWASRHPDSPLLSQFTYLRRLDDGTPATGSFPGWPDRASELTVMDPCCGSGHFLVSAFDILRQMRMEQEGLSSRDAGDAVLKDNLFGLELDARCTQIAIFAVVLAAWKSGRYRPLELPNIACSGIPVRGQWSEWAKLAQGDLRVETTLERLYRLFQDAPDIGSLIDPTSIPLRDRLMSADYAEVEPLLNRALDREKQNDPAAQTIGLSTIGIARVARMLASSYTLVMTNVPYLKRGRQGETLRRYLDRHHPIAKADLATAFVDRCTSLASTGGSYALVTPQNWWFLVSYTQLRQQFLRQQKALMFSRLGTGAFDHISGEVVNVGLVVATNEPPAKDHRLSFIDVAAASGARDKSLELVEGQIHATLQSSLLGNPDARISVHSHDTEMLLGDYADGLQGIATSDYSWFGRCFWELESLTDRWSFQQSTVVSTTDFGGREHILLWEKGRGALASLRSARVQGLAAVGNWGVAVSQMGMLPCTLYTGELFDNNTAIILPKQPEYLPAIWAFCKSPEYNEAVRRIDQALKVTNASLAKVPFDYERWSGVADEAGPMPEPHSNDPTQWLFLGNPVHSTDPLQVAVARLLGYRWPDQKADDLKAFADADGIVPLVPIGGERSAADRLGSLLAEAYGERWSFDLLDLLVRDAGAAGTSLEVWLRDLFFQQHCRRFHNRPFMWHIWDGERDGFSALVNYHSLDGAKLDRLIYTYLGSWVAALQAQFNGGDGSVEGRLIAAQNLQKKLKQIREGEKPYDIYVRWKPLHEQPIGWDPDLNDGVRMNIRPFVTAGVLRSKFSIHWRKDRGKDSDGSDRVNDIHLTLDEKRAARARAVR